MAGKGEKVAVDRLHVNRHVRNALGPIDAEHRPLRMRHLAKFHHRINCAQDVRHMRHGHQLGTGTNELRRLFHIELALRRDANIAHRRPRAPGDLLPGYDVAVMLHHRGDHFVASLQLIQAPGVGHQVQRLRGIFGKDHLIPGGVDKLPHLLVSLLVRQGGFLAEHVDAAVDIGVRMEIILPFGLNDRQRFLRRSAAVEIDERTIVNAALQNGEIAAHGFDIERRRGLLRGRLGHGLVLYAEIYAHPSTRRSNSQDNVLHTTQSAVHTVKNWTQFFVKPGAYNHVCKAVNRRAWVMGLLR